MAWRIHDSVIRGELDNRLKGVVRGRLWLHGRTEPVELELEGNACPDLAGCQLTFENRGVTEPMRPDAEFFTEQRGWVGDLTASRKVRVFDVPLEEALAMLKRGEKPPEHLANCLYLEWFSQRNGRVVVESADYVLSISAPEWRLSPPEEQQRRQDAARGWTGFLQGLNEAVSREQEKLPDDQDPEAWDEFDYEQFLRESDARTDKLMELYDKYETHPDADNIIAREMGWNDEEESDEVEGVGKDAGSGTEAASPVEEANAISGAAEELTPDPKTEGTDWVRDDQGRVAHPLYLRCRRAGMAAWDALDALGADGQNDPDLADFNCEFQVTAAKLAGALNGLAYGRTLRDAAFTVAYLKRALGHLHAAQAALERVAARTLLPTAVVTAARDDLFAIRQEILRLMAEFRGERDRLE